MRRLMKGMVLLLVVVGVAGCATMGAPEPSLYKRLGGREGIAVVVDDFVANVVADDRINSRFKALRPPDVFRLKSNLSDFICAASGGPCSYVGADMKAAHQGMKVTEAEWDATVEALVKALDRRQVPEREKRDLLGLLGPIKTDIVGQ
jgi:hemoglobin